MWETTGGSALSGDDSLTAALREVQEETGLILEPGCGTILHQYSGPDYHTDVWLFRCEFDFDAVTLQEGETCDKMSAKKETVRELMNAGLMVPYRYLEDVIYKS